MCKEITTVSSEIHTKHINTLSGQNVIFFGGGMLNSMVHRTAIGLSRSLHDKLQILGFSEDAFYLTSDSMSQQLSLNP